MEEKVLTRPTPIVAGNAFAALRLSRANRSSLGNRARRTGTVLVCLMFAFVACADEVTPRAVGLEATQNFPLALYKLHKKPETRRKLPDKLQEISGLAVTPEGVSLRTMTNEESSTN